MKIASTSHKSLSQRPRQRRLSPLAFIRNRKGQGLIEYLVIVALMGVATIAIVRVMSQTVSAKFATISYALRGVRKSVPAESIDESTYKKKDLGNFFDGVDAKGGSDGGGN